MQFHDHFFSWAAISVPHNQLKSLSASQKLKVCVTNGRTEQIGLTWFDYHGNQVFKSEVLTGAEACQLSYGTHPWLISSHSCGHHAALAAFIPYTTDVKITIE